MVKRITAILLSSIFLFAGCSKKNIVKNIDGVKMFPASMYKDLGYKLGKCPTCTDLFYIEKGDIKVILTVGDRYIFVNRDGYLEKDKIVVKDGEVYIPLEALKILPDGEKIAKILGE